jgi:glutamate racemase
MQSHSIGVFDSGYGGLTVLRHMFKAMPHYNYMYLGDNARSPYGTRSFETIYQYTLQAVKYLFEQGCPLVILACNTASARALRTIQQRDLPIIAPHNRVLGIIRPCVESALGFSQSGHIGVLGTPGTVKSGSYVLELERFFPGVKVTQESCPMWVPLVENQELDVPGTHYFVQKSLNQLLQQDPIIDSIILGCTHYPLLEPVIRRYLPNSVQLVSQGPLVAQSLVDYLARHPEIDNRLHKEGIRVYLTTEDEENFNPRGSFFLGEEILAKTIHF